jgi:hypothetical protein
MSARRPLSRQAVERLAKREASIGVEPDDEAAKWLAAHDPPPDPPKPASKNKLLHQWRRGASGGPKCRLDLLTDQLQAEDVTGRR